MTNNTVKVDGEASTSRLAGSLQHRPVLSGTTLLVSGPVLVLQDPLEEDHHVLQLCQVQATSVFLPSCALHNMALRLISACLAHLTHQVIIGVLMVHLYHSDHLAFYSECYSYIFQTFPLNIAGKFGEVLVFLIF